MNMMTESEVREAFDGLPPILDKHPRPNTWESYRVSIREHVKNDAFAEFLRWRTICATMFVGNEPFVRFEYDLLRKHNKHRWDVAIQEHYFGAPERLPWKIETSGNMIHQAYHLLQWEHFSGVKVGNLDRIVEFGGGYGAMARLVYRLGFRGEYVIYDLPEMSVLQWYYLSNVGVPVTLRATRGEWFYVPPEADLLISCHALGEAPDDLREAFLAHPFKSYLIASQTLWDGKNLYRYFADLASRRDDLSWHVWESPVLEDHYYWVGI